MKLLKKYDKILSEGKRKKKGELQPLMNVPKMMYMQKCQDIEEVSDAFVAAARNGINIDSSYQQRKILATLGFEYDDFTDGEWNEIIDKVRSRLYLK